MLVRALGHVRGHPLEAVLVAAMSFWLFAAAAHAGQTVAALLVAVLVACSLAAGRSWPVAALLMAFLGLMSVDLVHGGRSLEDAMLGAVVFACFLVGRWARPVLQPWAAAAVLLLLSMNVFRPDRDVTVGDVAFPTLITAAPWLLGLVVQLTAHRADTASSYVVELTDSRVHDLQRASDEERLRIARELHDLVAHHLSGVSLQAQVARRHAHAGGVVSVDELTAIEESARSALTDLRRVLGVLRPAAGEPATTPPEGLADLDDLVTRCRRAGQNVQVEVVGAPRELAPALSLVAYRVLQEAMTNARRHGSRGPTSVRLEWLESRLSIRVSNPSPGARTLGNGQGQGHGLLGITERVQLFGGQATAGPSNGTWNLEVTLPIPAPASEVKA